MLRIEKEELVGYLKDHSRKEAAEHFKVKVYVIDNLIREYNYKRETAKEKLDYFRKEVLPEEKLRHLYVDQKMSYSSIVETYNIPGDYLDALLREYGLGKRSTVKRILSQYSKEYLEDLYIKQNLSIQEMEEKLGTNYLNIKKALKSLGVENKSKDLIQQNIEKTILSKYGVKNIRQSDYFKERSAKKTTNRVCIQ